MRQYIGTPSVLIKVQTDVIWHTPSPTATHRSHPPSGKRSPVFRLDPRHRRVVTRRRRGMGGLEWTRGRGPRRGTETPVTTGVSTVLPDYLTPTVRGGGVRVESGEENQGGKTGPGRYLDTTVPVTHHPSRPSGPVYRVEVRVSGVCGYW